MMPEKGCFSFIFPFQIFPQVLLKYTEYDQPHESQTNSDILETIHRQETQNYEQSQWVFQIEKALLVQIAPKTKMHIPSVIPQGDKDVFIKLLFPAS